MSDEAGGTPPAPDRTRESPPSADPADAGPGRGAPSSSTSGEAGGAHKSLSEKSLSELQAEHGVSPRAIYQEHAEEKPWRNYIRDLILGFNDGVVSVYALVAGVAGAALATRDIALAGLAAMVAGALSMGLGEYISTKSQQEYYESEARREREHLRTHRDLERQELADMLKDKGYPADVRRALEEHISSDEDRFVDFMMREEFGVGKESSRSPIRAMFMVMGAFLIGAALPVVPYLVRMDEAIWAATALSLVGLAVTGAVKAKVSDLDPVKGALEMAGLAAVAAAVTFGIGRLVGGVVGL